MYRAALALGLANQLTNILRDVGEDIRTRSRIYIPLEDLRRFNIEESEVRARASAYAPRSAPVSSPPGASPIKKTAKLTPPTDPTCLTPPLQVINCSLVSPSGAVDPRWKELMKFQIERARKYFRDAEGGIAGLEAAARWPVWSALIVYSKILDAIEANDYDNFNKRAYVSKTDKMMMLPVAYAKANFSSSS